MIINERCFWLYLYSFTACLHTGNTTGTRTTWRGHPLILTVLTVLTVLTTYWQSSSHDDILTDHIADDIVTDDILTDDITDDIVTDVSAIDAIAAGGGTAAVTLVLGWCR